MSRFLFAVLVSLVVCGSAVAEVTVEKASVKDGRVSRPAVVVQVVGSNIKFYYLTDTKTWHLGVAGRVELDSCLDPKKMPAEVVNAIK